MQRALRMADHAAYHPLTRWLHAGLVLGVIFQLTCAVWMAHPEHAKDKHSGRAAIAESHPQHNEHGFAQVLMSAHRNGGVLLAFFVLANLLWAIIARSKPRKRQMAVLLSARHWREAIAIAQQLPSMLLGKAPLPEPGNALSLIFEMFGLLVMTAMAISGTLIWYAWAGPGNPVSAEAQELMEIHAAVALMLFFYLAGHISMALIHARAGDPIFARIVPWTKTKSSSQGETL